MQIKAAEARRLQNRPRQDQPIGGDDGDIGLKRFEGRRLRPRRAGRAG